MTVGHIADPTLARPVALPEGCHCPGTPHEADWINVRAELSGWEVNRYINAADEQAPVVTAKYVIGWNLTGRDGHVLPVDGESLTVLSPPTLSAILDALVESVTESSTPLPKAPGAPSRATSRASASPARTTRPRR